MWNQRVRFRYILWLCGRIAPMKEIYVRYRVDLIHIIVIEIGHVTTNDDSQN